MKHTRTLTFILLVGLLLVSPPSTVSAQEYPAEAVKECVSLETHSKILLLANPGSKIDVLTPKQVAALQYNFNKIPPVSAINITGAVVIYKPKQQYVLLAAAVDGCMKLQSIVLGASVKRIISPPKGA